MTGAADLSAKAIERGKKRVFEVFEFYRPHRWLSFRQIEIRAGKQARGRAFKSNWAYPYCKALVDEGILQYEKRKEERGRRYYHLTKLGRKLRKQSPRQKSSEKNCHSKDVVDISVKDRRTIKQLSTLLEISESEVVHQALESFKVRIRKFVQ